MLSLIPAKEGVDCEMGPRLREDDDQDRVRPFATPSLLRNSLMSSLNKKATSTAVANQSIYSSPIGLKTSSKT